MVKVLGIDLAPLNVPLERRIQTSAALFFTCMFTIIPVLCVLFLVVLLATPLFFLVPLYIAWIFYDYVVLEVSSRGGRRREWVRNLKFWHYLRDYFPADLIKTQDLDPDRNYLMAYHPHGIIGCGALINFSTEATGFSKKFPGIRNHVLTLKTNFMLPFTRVATLFLGLCDVSKESITWILTKQGKGNAVTIVVGGAEEALQAHPGSYKLTLKYRKGFVRMAIKLGADLVPIYSFGENDLYVQADNPEGSKLRWFQEKVKRVTGISPPLFHGRGVFNYNFGLLPFRRPINSVAIPVSVGAPICVEKNEAPEEELVNEYHQKYLAGLSQLFDEHKEKYGIDKDKTLEFI